MARKYIPIREVGLIVGAVFTIWGSFLLGVKFAVLFGLGAVRFREAIVIIIISAVILILSWNEIDREG